MQLEYFLASAKRRITIDRFFRKGKTCTIYSTNNYDKHESVYVYYVYVKCWTKRMDACIFVLFIQYFLFRIVIFSYLIDESNSSEITSLAHQMHFHKMNANVSLRIAFRLYIQTFIWTTSNPSKKRNILRGELKYPVNWLKWNCMKILNKPIIWNLHHLLLFSHPCLAIWIVVNSPLITDTDISSRRQISLTQSSHSINGAWQPQTGKQTAEKCMSFWKNERKGTPMAVWSGGITLTPGNKKKPQKNGKWN